MRVARDLLGSANLGYGALGNYCANRSPLLRALRRVRPHSWRLRPGPSRPKSQNRKI